MKKRKIVFLTGAGISKDSGIPTFRNDHNSLWDRYDVDQVANINNAFRNIDNTVEFFNALKLEILNAKPNAAHYAIAELQKDERFEVIVLTQNIDNFHLLSGSPKESVYELHGNIFHNVCRNIPELINSLIARQKGCYFVGEYYDHNWDFPTRCPNCGASSTFSPNVVLFNEALDPMIYSESIYHSSNADLFIQVGTSMNVFPVASLIEGVDISKRIYVDISEKNMGNTQYEKKFIGKAVNEIPKVCQLIINGEI